jgi:hypothetical protein
MERPSLDLRLARLLLALPLTCLLGCGKATPPADLDWARTHVQAGLDAWKKGQRPETLKNQSPAIDFQDQDWRAGLALLNYQLKDTKPESDQVPRCWVVLTLQDRRGKKFDKEVVYAVDKAKLTIGRDPFY